MRTVKGKGAVGGGRRNEPRERRTKSYRSLKVRALQFCLLELPGELENKQNTDVCAPS